MENDSIRINGSNLNDLFEIRSTGITVNGSALILNSINARTLLEEPEATDTVSIPIARWAAIA